MTTYKTCSKCGQPKSLDEFANDKRRPDGKYAQCKTCVHELYVKNREQRIAAARLRVRANTEEVKQYQHEYYLEHQEELKQKSADAYQETWPLSKEKRNQYAKEHAAEARERSKRWRKSQRTG